MTFNIFDTKDEPQTAEEIFARIKASRERLGLGSKPPVVVKPVHKPKIELPKPVILPALPLPQTRTNFLTGQQRRNAMRHEVENYLAAINNKKDSCLTIWNGFEEAVQLMDAARPPQVERCINLVVTLWRIPKVLLFSGTRLAPVARAKQACFWLIRRRPGWGGKEISYPRIGRWFAVDHTSVIHACRKLDERRKAGVK